MSKVGQPPVEPSVKLILWVIVELTRDRQNPSHERWSQRRALMRVEELLAANFLGGRVLTFETIKRHVREFNAIMRKSAAQRRLANSHLGLARQRRRDRFGWETSPWLLLGGWSDALTQAGFSAETEGRKFVARKVATYSTASNK
jgi:hypothetical protein